MSRERWFAFGPFRLDPHRRTLFKDGRPIGLTGRAFDLLTVLVEHRHETLSKDALKRLVWPDVEIVEDHNLTVTVANLRKALGDAGDAKRIVATLPGRGYRFVAPVELPSAGIGRAPAAARHNLPATLTRLIGRAPVLAEIAAALTVDRLVSVVGTGGVGKTRVALAAAAAELEQFPDGRWFVDLAPVQDPAFAAAAVARAIGLTLPGADTWAAIARFLENQRVLLLLDNCEHLIEPVAAAVERLLGACPALRVLATSREPLRVAGERLVLLQPLAVPHKDAAVTTVDIRSYPAAELLLERITFALGSYQVTDTVAQTIAELCRQLDGIPLALELIAPHFRTKGAAFLLDAAQRPTLLQGGYRGAPARQRSLEATIDWSYGRLSPAEQLLLQRVAVFAGGWTADAARAVAAAPPLDAAMIEPLMTELVWKSLIALDRTEQPQRYDLGAVRPNGAPAVDAQLRYRLLDTTRAFALERAGDAETAACQRRLARRLIDLFDRAEAEWEFTDDNEWFRRYYGEIDNLPTALGWCFGPGGNVELGVELVGHTCTRTWLEFALYAERERWLDVAMPHLKPETPVRVRARLLHGRHLALVGMGQRSALDHAIAIEALYAEAGEPMGRARMLTYAAMAALRPDDADEAQLYLDAAGALLDRAPPSKIRAGWLYVMAESRRCTGDPTEADRLQLEAAAVARQVGLWRVAFSFAAHVHSQRQELGLAVELTRKELSLYGDRAGYDFSAIKSRGMLAGFLLADGATVDAMVEAQLALRAALRIGFEPLLIEQIERIATIAAAVGQGEPAARLQGYLDAFHATHGPRDQDQQQLATRRDAALAGILSAAARRSLATEGAAWSDRRAAEEAAALQPR